MKKRISSILAAALIFALAACGSTTDPGAAEDAEQQTAASIQTNPSETADGTVAADEMCIRDSPTPALVTFSSISAGRRNL